MSNTAGVVVLTHNQTKKRVAINVAKIAQITEYTDKTTMIFHDSHNEPITVLGSFSDITRKVGWPEN